MLALLIPGVGMGGGQAPAPSNITSFLPLVGVGR